MFLRFHFARYINLDKDKYDTYAGLDLNFKSIGAHAGGRYKFNEIFGVYLEVSQGFSDSMYHYFSLNNLNNDSQKYENNFGKRFLASAGISINLVNNSRINSDRRDPNQPSFNSKYYHYGRH